MLSCRPAGHPLRNPTCTPTLYPAALREHIEKRGWTQSEAAKKLGITQPRISALMKGAWRDFSADMLLVLATRLGLRPTLKLAA
jgi:predicted XRE-type DNA-binding protein